MPQPLTLLLPITNLFLAQSAKGSALGRGQPREIEEKLEGQQNSRKRAPSPPVARSARRAPANRPAPRSAGRQEPGRPGRARQPWAAAGTSPSTSPSPRCCWRRADAPTSRRRRNTKRVIRLTSTILHHNDLHHTIIATMLLATSGYAYISQAGRSNACMHICIYAYMHICMHAYMHVCMHAYMHICMHAYMHICIYAYMHACIRAPRLRDVGIPARRQQHRGDYSMMEVIMV